MKVTIDGVEQKMHPANHCTGYSAEAISLDDADLRELAKLSPRDLYATVQQLAGRVRPMTVRLTADFPGAAGMSNDEIREALMPGQPTRFAIAPGESLKPGDDVGVNDEGELQKAIPGINHVGKLPANTIVRKHIVLVPEGWPSR